MFFTAHFIILIVDFTVLSLFELGLGHGKAE